MTYVVLEIKEIVLEKKSNLYVDKKVIVSDIYWERVFLHFNIESLYCRDLVFALKNIETQEIVIIKEEAKINSVYHFCINIVAVKKREFLDNGKWVLVCSSLPYTQQKAEMAGDNFQCCALQTELGYKLETLSRVFRYGEDEFAYTINFVPFSDNSEDMTVFIESYFMKKNKKWKKRGYSIKTEDGMTAKVIKMVLFPAVVFGMNLSYRVFRAFNKCFCGANKKNLLLMNETGELNAGNLSSIYNRLIERKLEDKIKVSCSFRRAVGGRESIWSWLKLLYKISCQDIIILDNYAPIFNFLKLQKSVRLIQVWHAGGGFKAVGYCRFGKEGSPFPTGSCHKAYTLALTGSNHLIKVFQEVFGIEKEAFFPAGMPRLDGYLDRKKIEDFRDEFYKKYPELKKKEIILFAPTYRGKGQKAAYYDYSKIDLKRIYDVCGEKYIFLIKMHPFIKESILIPEEYRERILDFSDYPSINQLFYVTDLLITDYSSNFYEFSLMKKPMIFYTYDRQIYELTRGVYRGIKEAAPGKVCDSFEELIEAIENQDYEYEKVATFIKENFDEKDEEIDGATDRLIDNIILGNL